MCGPLHSWKPPDGAELDVRWPIAAVLLLSILAATPLVRWRVLTRRRVCFISGLCLHSRPLPSIRCVCQG